MRLFSTEAITRLKPVPAPRPAAAPSEPAYRFHRSPLSRLASASFALVNRLVPWHRLPPFLGAMNLLSFREVLREKNLVSTDQLPVDPAIPTPAPGPMPSPELLYRRASEGTCNDLGRPLMGAAYTRFGRNVPLDQAHPDPELRLLSPSPRLVSNRLLARREFVPASSLNLLAAAWIQFMVHDWFNHGTPAPGNEFRIPLDHERGDAWHEDPMLVRRTPRDPTRGPGGGPPTFLNHGSHWWDASQVYGNSEQETLELRCTDEEGAGKLRLARAPAARGDGDGQQRARRPKPSQEEKEREEEAEEGLPIDARTRLEQAGVVENWWIGLSLLHTLFAKEHNAIVDRLRLEYPGWSGDRLFHAARLVNAALMAKIHTVEWTTAILGHPALDLAMNANWWGLATERVTRLLGRLSSSSLLSGIPGSPVEHHSAPYALTEEFVAVYRLHPLMPEGIQFYSVKDGTSRHYATLPEVAGDRSLSPIQRGLTRSDLLYSFGVANPGAPVLHNYPGFMRTLERVDRDGDGREIGRSRIDLATIDVMRDRERGVPRYNRFRQLVHREPARSFSGITSNAEWARELKEVYRDPDRVDLMVGMYAEDLPEGFGFSDTAFRIFILMASRRLQSDRFFTTDWNERTYTPAGMDWITRNTFASVLLRHYPRLAPVLRGVRNGFAPWTRLEEAFAGQAGR
jgi:hypothetical protein